MSRPLRIEFPGATYHVMGRGVARSRVFLDDADRIRFLDLIEEQVIEEMLMVHAFCLMSNHFHLLCETPHAGLGSIMQKILSCYSRRFNKRYQRVGRLWQDRYKAILVDGGEYFLECSRYIHLNPQETSHPEPAQQYRWSSYRNYLEKDSAVDWISQTRTLSMFSSRRDYIRFVESKAGKNIKNPFEAAEAGLIFGSESFVEEIKELAEGRDNGKEEDIPMLQKLRRIENTPSVDAIGHAVAESCSALSVCQQNRILAYAIYKITFLKLVEISEVVGRTPGSVSRTIRDVDRRIREDPGWGKLFSRLKVQLFEKYRECDLSVRSQK